MSFKVPDAVLADKDKLFKSTAYDIRAYVGEPGAFFEDGAVLTPDAMRTAGAMMGALEFRLHDGGVFSLKTGDAVVIGHDNGPTSKVLSDAFSEGLTGQGINVYYIGIASSGQVYHNQQQLNSQGHVQITRSHVEVTTNGAKFAIGENGIHTYLLGQMNAALAGFKGRDATPGRVYDKTAEGRSLYIKRMKDRYGAYFKSNPRKIALNLFGGTAVEYKDMFTDIFGDSAIILGNRLDVNKGDLLADPTRKEMLARVPGFTDTLGDGMRIYSFDLDADRLSVTEGTHALDTGALGHYLGDDLAYILADYKLNHAVPALFAKIQADKNIAEKVHEICTVVYVDPRYSSGVRSYILKNGGTSIYHRKGHSLWKETMTANLSKVAGLLKYADTKEFVTATGYQDLQIEASLHLFTSDADDGVVRDDGLESVFILEKICDALGIESLASYYEPIPKRFVTKEIRTQSSSNELKEAITREIISMLKVRFSGKDYSVVEFDGQVRIDWDTGFIMYGMSNTSPKLTFMAEGSTVAERNEALAYILAMHNAVKKQYGDNLPMDLGENSFFCDDLTFDMKDPDSIAFDEPRAMAFAAAHRL